MLRGQAVSERVRDQALSPLECDIPPRVSIAEYRKGRPAARRVRRKRKLRIVLTNM